jgi:hypothetical protein
MRPAISRQLKRDVLVEAGHRCAITTCHQPSVEIAQIKPWVEVKEHTFDNLIALCPTCHVRYDKGEIDRSAMLQYKANLSIINGRYGDLEQRVLRYFSAYPDRDWIYLARGFDILLMYLFDDSFLVETTELKYQFSKEGTIYNITPKGREFVDRWLRADKLE